MAGRYILAIDQGTSSTRAFVVDAAGAVAGMAQETYPQQHPQPGWVEQDPADIWQTTQEVMRTALAGAGVTTSELAAIGIANQRESVVLWDRATGAPVTPVVVWEDRRSARMCEELRAAGHEDSVRRATGLTLDPYFTGTKLAWMLREDATLRESAEHGELAMGTIDAFLIWNLTGGERHATDFTNASRTLLFNIGKGRWDEELCDLLGVPASLLPRPQPSRSNFGTTDPDFFGAAVPILGVAGDQQAALFGQACLAPGQAKNTYGTGCFLLASAGRRPIASRHRLLLSIGPQAGAAGPDYVLEGTVFVAGAAVQWLRDELGIIRHSDEVEQLARTVPDAGGVTFVPAFTGLGAPDWDPHARGGLFGLTSTTNRGHIARATLDAIALSSAELLGAMADDLGAPFEELRVDGGAAKNDLLMQLQADYAGVPVVRPANVETTAMGAAYLAGIGAGIWASAEESATLWKADRTFDPQIGESERAEALAGWRNAVERVRSEAEGKRR